MYSIQDDPNPLSNGSPCPLLGPYINFCHPKRAWGSEGKSFQESVVTKVFLCSTI